MKKCSTGITGSCIRWSDRRRRLCAVIRCCEQKTEWDDQQTLCNVAKNDTCGLVLQTWSKF